MNIYGVAAAIGFAAGFACGGAEARASALAAPAHLTVDYMADPVGLDTPAPRLSWKLSPARPDARDLRQSAYQVLVASSPEKLARDEGDLWDSGRIESDRSINIAYSGAPLPSSQRCHWKVRAWDVGHGAAPSPWSAPGRWIMGVMRPEDWTARWIGAHAATRPDFDLSDAHWIWAGDAESVERAPAGRRFFRKVFDVPANAAGGTATLALTGDDTFEVQINGQLAARNWGHINRPRWLRFVEVTKLLKPGRNVMAVVVVNEPQGPTGLLAVLRLGDGARIPTDASWRVSAKGFKDWTTDETETDRPGWTAAAVAGPADCAPWGKIERRVETASPAFEKTFTARRAVREATLHISGLGYYEASLNGARIGRKVLDPPPTRYDKRVLYSTYNLTGRIQPGENRMNVLLGHGWYDVRSVAVWNFDNAPWRDFPRMIAQIEMVYEDGSRDTVATDATWRQTPSPIGYDCIREGEIVGMRPPNAHDFDAAPLTAEIVPAPAGRLAAAAMPPSVVSARLPPAAIREVRPGVWTVDFGQNIAGWVRLSLKGQAAGDTITVRYGERIAEDGSVDMKPIDEHFRYPTSRLVLPGGHFQTDRFVCDGSPEQTYEPRFTYSGFQYAEIHGLNRAPDASTIRACVVQTEYTEAGTFECSHELLNKIQRAILEAYRGNFVNGYPMDCPHREKNGWTGDAQLAAELAMYNVENTAAYAKWTQDMIDEQQPDGNLAAIIPSSGWGYKWGNGPAWDAALFVIPWMTYIYRGDERTLETAYDAMRRYVDYMTSRSTNGIVSHGLGDWVPVKSKTPAAVTSTGYFFLGARTVARAAEVLGKPGDAVRYSALADSIREAFNREFHAGDGVVSIGSQTAQGCALHQRLVLPDRRAAVEARLIEAVEKTGGFPDFGILGSKYVFRSLTEAGRSDLALAMALKEEAPSFGSWIRRGATTFWEDWGEGKSRNHVMFGDISAWFYQVLGGIQLAPEVSPVAERVDPDRVAFREFVIRPEFLNGIDWVRADHDSPYGMIRSHWKRDKGTVTLDVNIPVNTAAIVILPATSGAGSITSPVAPVSSDADRVAFRVGSGRHSFTVR